MIGPSHGYDWASFRGPKAALKWNRRDIPCLNRMIKCVKDRRVAVQAGGHLGVFPKVLAKSFGLVITFEPSPDLFPHLCANAPESNIIRVPSALGQQRGLVSLACTRRGRPGPIHEGLTHIAGEGSIPMLRLDDLRLPIVNFVQFDLEGYELYALRGAAETIARCRPVIAVEINDNCQFYGISQETIRFWFFQQDYRRVLTLQSDEVFVPC